uniref:Uncharacterized protein n=1 Tax=Rhizophora mucronata TaxID=61149 RepID=A0A2P2QCW1_RHIMU
MTPTSTKNPKTLQCKTQTRFIRQKYHPSFVHSR